MWRTPFSQLEAYDLPRPSKAEQIEGGTPDELIGDSATSRMTAFQDPALVRRGLSSKAHDQGRIYPLGARIEVTATAFSTKAPIR